MPRLSPRSRIESLLALADVHVDGKAPTDLIVHDERFYARAIAHGSLGLGEAYMDGWWDAEDLDGMLFRLLNAHVDEQVHGVDDAALFLRAKLTNLQRGKRAYAVGEQHYDLGNDLFSAMLGRRLVYSCGYWHDVRVPRKTVASDEPILSKIGRVAGAQEPECTVEYMRIPSTAGAQIIERSRFFEVPVIDSGAEGLDLAQEAKLDLVCRKLGLRPGMRVLDIGCGWGEALKYAVEKFSVSGVGITVSQEQAEFARKLCRGLPVEIRVQDYHALDEKFDRSWSIGMFEHVGVKNYRAYFETARRCLTRDGLHLLHTIGGNESTSHTDPWIEKYIFPNSMIPSAAQIAKAAEKLFVLEDWHGFGPDYDATLMAWCANFDAAWPRLATKYGERFRRMWRFYLSASAANFRARRLQLWQSVWSPYGVPGGYVASR